MYTTLHYTTSAFVLKSWNQSTDVGGGSRADTRQYHRLCGRHHDSRANVTLRLLAAYRIYQHLPMLSQKLCQLVLAALTVRNAVRVLCQMPLCQLTLPQFEHIVTLSGKYGG